MCNRNDQLTEGPGGLGVRCEWTYSRALHVCNVFPVTGRWLLLRALHQWPMELDGNRRPPLASRPAVSFIIGHRGNERLAHLLATLCSIQKQVKIDFECIVVEQDVEPLIRDRLPDWVRYVHAPRPEREVGYNRSAALNAGVRQSRGQVLILHDHDMLVPADYAAEAWRLYEEGYEVMQLKRFVFYLDQASTHRVFAAGTVLNRPVFERVVENMEGGASLAISAKACEALGGMDEEFIGWGGEDNEFWDRCLTRKVWDYGYLPFVHLWHPSLANRQSSNPMLSLLAEKRTMSAQDRIAALRALRESETALGHQEGIPPCC